MPDRSRAAAYAGEVLQVRMGMSERTAARLDELMPCLPNDVVERVLDQLWLRSALVEQRRRTVIAERGEFDTRADEILEALDPQDVAA